MTTINANDYIANIDKNKDITVDVRTPMEIKSESIHCKLNLNASECTAECLTVALEKAGISKDQTVFLLCQSGARADQVMKKVGVDFPWKLVKINGGLNALKQAGVQVSTTSKSAMSLERQVRIAAGALVVIGVVLAHLLHPNFVYLSGFVGAGLVFAGLTNTCAMGLLIAKMPWNQH